MQLISLLFYNIFIRSYWLGVAFASFFNSKAKFFIQGRKYWRCGLGILEIPTGKKYWFHCASLGEFEQARPLIEKLKLENNNPNQIEKNVIILTFFSPSGYEIRKNYAHADVLMYLPMDTHRNATIFINSIKPDVAIFVKYEFWHYYTSELKKQNIPTILISSIFRKEQVFFKWYGLFFKNILSNFSKIFVQNSASQDLLKTISVESEICFDTRFDRVNEIAKTKKTFSTIENFKGDLNLFIAGSTWAKDEELIIKSINENVLKGYKYILVPHTINQSKINALILSTNKKAIRYSELNAENANEYGVVIVDSIGLLSALYAHCEIAYVGGGFNASVHNILEAAVYGVPVLFGPNYKKSQEAKDLIIYEINDYTSFSNALLLLEGETKRKELGLIAENYVKHRLGGSETIFNYLKALN